MNRVAKAVPLFFVWGLCKKSDDVPLLGHFPQLRRVFNVFSQNAQKQGLNFYISIEKK